MNKQRILVTAKSGLVRREVSQTYSITLSDLAEQISAFDNCRSRRCSDGTLAFVAKTYLRTKK